jgi:hypothetical protein
MAKKTLAAIRANIRQSLRDEFGDSDDYVWADDELDIYIGSCLVKLSKTRPYMVKEVLTTIANSKVLDISDIEDLLWIDKAEYPTGNDPRNFRNVIELDAEQIEIDTTITPSAGGSGVLTGIVTFTSGSAAITGSGTAFSTELEVGYHIKKSTVTRWYRVYSIESDTALTLAEACLETTGADEDGATQYCYETVYLYCAKLHTLTESSSTLNPQMEEALIQGVCGTAAVAKARSLIDRVNIGGGRTPADMQAWGVGQLGLFQAALNELARPRVFREYPKD